MTFEFVKQKYILCSQLLKLLRIEALLLWQNLNLLVTEPSVFHAEASQSVLDFWYYSINTRRTNIEKSIDITD